MRTLEEFVNLVCTPQTGTRYREVAGRQGPNGPPSRRYLVRFVDGQPLTAQLPTSMRENDLIRDGVARVVLENLGLTPSDFGY